MSEQLLPWIAITIEIIGILLVAIELYVPRLSESLKQLFEQTKPRVLKRPVRWIFGYCMVWVLASLVASLYDPTLILVTNIIFVILTVLVLMVLTLSRGLVRVGVAIGRGNSVGGVGLILAVIGLSIEIYQLPPF